MKKYYLLIALSLIMSIPSIAQEIKSNRENIAIIDSLGNEVMSIHSKDKNALNISVGGIDIISFNKKQPKAIMIPGVIHTAPVELGFNFLTKPDYSDYPAEEQGFLNLNNARSISIVVNTFGYTGYFDKRKHFSVGLGLSLLWNNYVFAEKITMKYEDKKLTPVVIDSKYKKSKFNTFSLRFPLLFTYDYNKFFVSAGGYIDLMLGARTKIKFPKEKVKNGMSYMDMFQAGVSGKIGYRATYVKLDYNLTPLFKTGIGPKTKSMTVGLGLFF